MSEARHSIQRNLDILISTPGRISESTQGLTPAQLTAPPARGEWSARDVLAHLRACADVWGKYIGIILREDRPTFKAVTPRTWIERTDYLELPFETSLWAFTAQRAQLLRTLEPLPAKSWARSATVTGAGKPLQKAVLDYAIRMADHERVHVRQMTRLVDALRRLKS